MKWVFNVIVLIYICHRTVYGAKHKTVNSLSVEAVDYGKFENYLPPGSVKTIACKYANINQQVEWRDPFGNPVPQVKTNRIFTQKHISQTPRGVRVPTLLLSIADASVDDSGDYECRSGALSETVSLCIIDPLEFVDTPSEVNVDEGRSFTLTCEARGRPEPRLVWYRNEEVISDDCNSTKYKVMTKFNSQGFQGQLTIMSIEPGDAGSYTCAAIQEHNPLEDCSISKLWNITLNVNYAPVFEDGNVTVLFAKYNESIDLDCEPKAYPTPKFRWYSKLNEETLLSYAEDKVTVSDDQTSSKITIVANALTFGIKYVCRAINTVGDTSKTFTVLKIEKPNQPDEVNVMISNATEIYFNVSWWEEIQFPVDAIYVQYLEKVNNKLPKESEWRRGKSETIKLENQVVMKDSVSVVYVNISELEPDTEYWVRLRATNDLGYSPWSSPIEAATDALEEPTEAPEETRDGPKVAGATRNDSMVYGVIFAGGLLVVSFICMLISRLF